MANKSPIFPMPESHHFSDYGFDPQIDYFQFLEEARKHKRDRDTTSFKKPIDSLHFKLQKPISKEDSGRKTHHRKKHWWKKAFFFFKLKWIQTQTRNEAGGGGSEEEDVHRESQGFPGFNFGSPLCDREQKRVKYTSPDYQPDDVRSDHRSYDSGEKGGFGDTVFEFKTT